MHQLTNMELRMLIEKSSTKTPWLISREMKGIQDIGQIQTYFNFVNVKISIF